VFNGRPKSFYIYPMRFLLALFFLSLLGVWQITYALAGGFDPVIKGILLGTVTICLGVFGMAYCLRSKFSLYQDRVIQIQLQHSIVLEKKLIKGYRIRTEFENRRIVGRTVVDQNAQAFVELVPSQMGLQSIKIPIAIASNPYFISWLRGFADLEDLPDA
jgi:hypothetical protein